MEHEFWRARWAEDKIGFHRQDVHPLLSRFKDRFDVAGRRVLVPLCGKSCDIVHLAAEAREVVGIELVPKAVRALFENAGVEPEVTSSGPFEVYSHERLKIYCGDVMAADPERLGFFERIWDRAALVALDPPRRERYVEVVRSLAGDGAHLLQSCVEYDDGVMSGPPWSVTDEDIASYYGDLAVEQLFREDGLGDRWKERGHRYWFETGYLIRFPI